MENDRWDEGEDFGEEFGFTEIPAEARDIIDKAERLLREIQHKLNQDTEDINERAQKEIAALQKRARQKLRLQRLQLLDQLKPMMEAFAREGKLEEALALHEHLRKLRGDTMGLRPDPGSLLDYHQAIGKTFMFEVSGSTQGPLWGTEVYTADSYLATAAVHAGVLRQGERGYLRVSVVDMTGMIIEGSERNGVWSNSWGPYPFGFRVDRA